MQITTLNTFKVLQRILIDENINYSLGIDNYLEYKNNPEHFLTNEISVCLWHEDFYKLYKKYPHFFTLPENLIGKTLAPCFKQDGTKININIIVGTTSKKIDQLYKFKTYKQIAYWGNSKNHWFHYLLGTRTERVILHNLINQLKESRYMKFIILGANVDQFKIFTNLNYNNRFWIEDKGVKVPFFSQFKNA